MTLYQAHPWLLNLSLIDLKEMSRLVLGTANFGNAYGVANRGETLSSQGSMDIVQWAQVNGINHFDTAIAYGQALDLLGANLDKALNPVIDAKLDGESCQTSELIVLKTKEVLRRLGVDQLSVLYLHNENLLNTPIWSEIKRGLEEVLNLGLCKKIGVSVYSEESIVACKQVVPNLSVFQVPENICDRRLLGSQKIEQLASEGNSFLVRSTFLQGLLLMEPDEIPEQLSGAVSGIQVFRNFAEEHSISRMNLCLAYANSISWSDGIIVGVASLAQLKEIVECETDLPLEWDTLIPKLPVDILDPRKWKL